VNSFKSLLDAKSKMHSLGDHPFCVEMSTNTKNAIESHLDANVGCDDNFISISGLIVFINEDVADMSYYVYTKVQWDKLNEFIRARKIVSEYICIPEPKYTKGGFDCAEG